ncbi:MAG: restriction endonuclease subunit S [Candidatus Geothermincolia bacterium]
MKVRDIIDGRIAERDLLLTHRSIDEAYKRSRIIPGDVLITIRGTTGRVAIVSATLDGANITQDTARARVKDGIDGQFIYFLLQSKNIQQQIALHTVGQAVKGINIRDVRRLSLALPDIVDEQRAIAAALSDVDALLGGLDRLIAKKRDLKQAAMQQLLTGQTRLPGFHGEWEVKRLGELADIVSGGTPRTTEQAYWNGGIKWCTPTDITGCPDKYLGETERTITPLGLQHSGASLLPAGALLLCSRATIGEVKIASGEICTNQGFKSLVCAPDVNNEFLYYKLLTMKQKMLERAFGSTFLEISKANVAALEVDTPPLPEQLAIAAVLSDMDAELAALEARRDKTRALKQAMMQELLTGRTRLV